MILANYGISLETVRFALGQVNSNQAKGRLDNGIVRWTLTDNDQLFGADHYRSIIVAYHNGAPVRLADIATVQDSVENIYNAGLDKWAALYKSSDLPPARREYRWNRR